MQFWSCFNTLLNLSSTAQFNGTISLLNTFIFPIIFYASDISTLKTISWFIRRKTPIFIYFCSRICAFPNSCKYPLTWRHVSSSSRVAQPSFTLYGLILQGAFPQKMKVRRKGRWREHREAEVEMRRLESKGSEKEK